MHKPMRSLALIAAVAVCFASIPGLAAPQKGNGGFRGTGSGGGGSGSGGGGGNNALIKKNVGSGLNTTGSTGAGSNNTARSFKSNTGLGNTGVGTSGAGTNFQNQNLLKNKNLNNLNQTQTNHTPTFTNPAIVTTPKKTIGGIGSNANTGLNTNTGVNTNNLLNKNKVQLNQNLNNLNNANNLNHHVNKNLGTNQFQTFQKTKTGPFAAHAINGNQLLLQTKQGQIQKLNAHAYNQTFFGNKALLLAPVGYQPSYLLHSSFYNSPWSGNAWGWGWGLGPGFGYGFGGLGWGFGIGSGWGYGFGGSPLLYGPYGYWGHPLGWGFGGWGLGTLCYNSGYYPYYNPYYVTPVNQTIVYNYSNPVPVATNVASDPSLASVAGSPPPQTENPDFDAARAAFRNGDYAAALAKVDAAIAKSPTDSVMHEFRALVLFARQDYKQAAGVIHSLLAVGPGWDWTTMSGLYADPAAYTQHLRTLEQFTRTNPKAADAHFLLAYHYTTTGHSDAAANQLQQVVKLLPDDRLAGELLKMIQGPPKADPATPPAPEVAGDDPATPPAEGPEPDPIDKDLLPGAWKATRPDGSKFDLKLTDDGKFTWKFSTAKQKGEEFAGTWSVEGPVLLLQREGNGALPGTVTFSGNGKFNFRMVGAPPEDKGLDFSK
jgi:tetratricopeptide (TPR) repeat protein